MKFLPNQPIDQKFAVLNIQTKKTAAGDPFLNVELSNQDGAIQARVWSEAMSRVSLSPGKVFQIQGVVDFFQGEPMINIKSTVLVEESPDSYLSPTPTMVFDIETLGYDFDKLDQSDQDYFLKRLEKDFEGDQRQLHGRTGLYPMFGSVLTIGLMNHGEQKGKVLYVSNDHTRYEVNSFESVSFSTESEMISAFWEIAASYDRFVTFNGTGFDFPFLMYRSAVHRIKVPFETNGPAEKFVDLSYKFRMNNRAFKLEVICKSLGISNPKQPGVSGMEVANLFKAGRMEDIVKYVSRDVAATSELYEIWRKYLAGRLIV